MNVGLLEYSQSRSHRDRLSRPASFPTLLLRTPEICSIDLLASLSPKVTILISQIMAIHPRVSAESGNSRGKFSEQSSTLEASRPNYESLPRKTVLSALTSIAGVSEDINAQYQELGLSHERIWSAEG